jgi:malonyl-CoA/methylmalonyl-CoA synthetase
VLMSCTPSVPLVLVHLGALLAGATVVPVNTGFTADELHNIADAANSHLAVLSDTTRWDRPDNGQHADDTANADDAEDASVSRKPLGLDTLTELANQQAAGQLSSSHGWEVRLDRLRSDDPALLLFTSGTTGTPKGALLSHGNALASACAVVTAWRWTPADRLVLCLPLFHMHGLGVGIHGTLLAGASAVILSSFDENTLLDSICTYDVTMLFGVPTIWTRLAAHARVGELRTLRLCVSGSAPLTPEVWTQLRERAGQEILERYGMTETVMLTSNPYSTTPTLTRRPGSVGLVLPGVELGLHDQGADGVGEIVVRGPNVFDGYLDRPDANAEAFLNDGWFRTGDLGTVDAQGYLTIVGRSKDLIITGGYNVYPSDIEAVLRLHPQVADVAVVGEPSTLWGETVAACVVLNDHLAADATANPRQVLLDFAASHLADYQRPRRIAFYTEFPRNALGKVIKSTLREHLQTHPQDA